MLISAGWRSKEDAIIQVYGANRHVDNVEALMFQRKK
jgi:hypothetical protein